MFSENEEDEVSGLAGWMYTDLLLGLMVIFLATITFVPEQDHSIVAPKKIEPTVSIKSKAPTSSKSLEEINFIAEIEVFNASVFKERLDNFKKNERVSNSSKLIEAQLIGSYDPASETTGAGISRALEYGRDLEGAFPDLLKGVDASVETFISTRPKVLIRLTYRI